MHALQREYVCMVENYRSQYPAAHWCFIDHCLEDAVFSDGKVVLTRFLETGNTSQVGSGQAKLSSIHAG
jgi:hypothetical protein